MATETALSALSAGSYPTTSIPTLRSTSHLKNMRSLCSTLYKDDDNAVEEGMNKSGKRGRGKLLELKPSHALQWLGESINCSFAGV